MLATPNDWYLQVVGTPELHDRNRSRRLTTAARRIVGGAADAVEIDRSGRRDRVGSFTSHLVGHAPPFEHPVAYTRFGSMQVSALSCSSVALTNATSSTFSFNTVSQQRQRGPSWHTSDRRSVWREELRRSASLVVRR